MLSPEEQKTLDSYQNVIAKTRGKTHGNPDFWRDQFEKFKKLLPKGKIIDIGCGAGRDAPMFMEENYEYVGVDISEKMLEEARKYASEATFLEMSMYSLDFPEDSFDGFWAAASLLHVPKKKLASALNQINKVVKKDGVGFIVIKEGFGEKILKGKTEGDERFFAFYEEEEFAELLEQNGLKVLENKRDMRNHKPPQDQDIYLLYFVKVK